jgi:hypothetical protein
VIVNARLIAMPARVNRASATINQIRGETSEMLAPLAVFLLLLLITCSLTLLISWAYDNCGVDIEAGPSRLAVLEFPVHLHRKRFRPVCATLNHPPGSRARSVVIQRGAAELLRMKAHLHIDKSVVAQIPTRKTPVVSAEACVDCGRFHSQRRRRRHVRTFATGIHRLGRRGGELGGDGRGGE